jgi:hypothetical protein
VSKRLYRNVASRSRTGRRLKSEDSTTAAAVAADAFVRSILREMTHKLRMQEILKMSGGGGGGGGYSRMN